jgi:hypothetical protein
MEYFFINHLNRNGGIEMKKFLLTLAILSMLVSAINANALTTYSNRTDWNNSVTGITTIDFTGMGGEQMSSLTSGTVTFDVPDNYDSGALWVSTPGAYEGLGEALVGNHWMTTLRATFNPGTTAIGTDVYNLYVTDSIAVSIMNDDVLSSYSVPVTLGYGSFFGVTTDSGYISEITFSPSNYWVGIDNFSLATTTGGSVPEPATMLLLGSGLVGLAGLRRKFKK